jgi:hypothetical protein
MLYPIRFKRLYENKFNNFLVSNRAFSPRPRLTFCPGQQKVSKECPESPTLAFPFALPPTEGHKLEDSNNGPGKKSGRKRSSPVIGADPNNKLHCPWGSLPFTPNLQSCFLFLKPGWRSLMPRMAPYYFPNLFLI